MCVARGVQSWEGFGQQQAVFKSEIDLVRVDALVTKEKEILGGLQTSDFELRDNGVAQQIVSASLEQVPIDAVLVLDLSGSINARNAQSLRNAALAFLEGLTSQDRVGVLTFSGRSALVQRLTGDLPLVRRRLADLDGGGSTALNDAIYAGLRLREPGVTRAAVVVFTDGVDNISWLSAAEVVKAGKQSDSIVHAVVADLSGSALRAADNPLLHDLARDTGGQVWSAAWGPLLADAFRAVLENLRSRYVLTYYPTGVASAGWHDLDVKVKRSGTSVTARTGYYRSVTRR
jgi:VWFA-related protein